MEHKHKSILSASKKVSLYHAKLNKAVFPTTEKDGAYNNSPGQFTGLLGRGFAPGKDWFLRCESSVTEDNE